MKTPKSAPSTAASQSASAKKMLGDLPPSSRLTRFSVSAALFTYLADRRAAGEGDFVDARMWLPGRAGDLAKAV